MLIIIEGADKNGKTTLASHISERHGYNYIHHGPPRNGYMGYMDEILDLKNKTVMDRSFIGEMIYGPLLRGRSCIDNNQFDCLLKLSDVLNGVVIHCHQSDETKRLWHVDDKELKIDWTMNIKAAKRFEVLMECEVKPRIKVIDYNANTLKDMDKFVDKLIKEINHE